VDSTSSGFLQPSYVALNGLVPCAVHVKLEGLNAAGSIKIKTGRQLLGDLRDAGRLRPGSRVIESSSGNLGIALGLLCAELGYSFTCVTDPNAPPSAVAKMKALGVEVLTVVDRDQNGSFLGTRIDLIRSMCAADPELVWVDQYGSASNWKAHYRTTGPEILAHLPQVDYLIIGAGTTGTLTGCARYFRERSPGTVVVGVDATGSVTFGGPSGVRHIPGLGTSRRPPIADDGAFDRLVLVDELDAVRMCHGLARTGLLVGGSTGSVLHATSTLASELTTDSVVVAVSPDMGDKYLDTIYSDRWLAEKFPAFLSGSGEEQAAPWEHLSVLRPEMELV
jgi:N-(2-amino-2-carboxyethyl)-L-glutamate synthase